MVMLFQIPWVKSYWSSRYPAVLSSSTPWKPLGKPLQHCKIAVITTGGVHLKTDKPFDMLDKEGDPSFRLIPSATEQEQLAITHDYYDHSDADKDINLVLPVDALKEAQQMGLVGESAEHFYGLMGHVGGQHLKTLVEETAQLIIRQLKLEKVDVVLLVPA